MRTLQQIQRQENVGAAEAMRIQEQERQSSLAGAAGSAVCGNCGKTLSEHYHEDQKYCFKNTTGDIFTDDPSDTILADYLRATYPELHSSYVIEWKKRNGHQPNGSYHPRDK